MSPLIYSIAIPLNRGGMATIAWHACRALLKAGVLRWAVSPETGAAGEVAPRSRCLPWPFQKMMAVLNRLGWHHLHDDFFDRWSSRWLEPGDHYYGWLHQSLASIRRCHAKGGKTFVDRGSVEPRLQDRWLREEYLKHGLSVDPIRPWSVRRMVQEADETDWIVVPSSLVAESYVAADYRPCKILVNPLGTHPVDFGLVSKNDDIFRFVFAGQLSIQKGLTGLLQAWNHLSPEKAELVLAGVIPEKEKKIIKPFLREARNVVWKGHCQDIVSLFKKCDVLILPSAQDGFGLVVLEAFACGLPVIVSDRVGARDCVERGKNGFVFEYGKPQALEEKMDWFLKDRSRADGMRVEAQKTAMEYSWEKYGERLAEMVKKKLEIRN